MQLMLGMSLTLLLLAGHTALYAQQPPAAQECPNALRIEQDASTYGKQLAARLLQRAEKAEQDLVQAKQQQERTEEELTRIRQAWEEWKTKTHPSN